jgi:hypothetical protein
MDEKLWRLMQLACVLHIVSDETVNEPEGELIKRLKAQHPGYSPYRMKCGPMISIRHSTAPFGGFAQRRKSCTAIFTRHGTRRRRELMGPLALPHPE